MESEAPSNVPLISTPTPGPQSCRSKYDKLPKATKPSDSTASNKGSASTPRRKDKRPQVEPRYLDVTRSSNYIRIRNQQLQRRRELERSNLLRTNERKEQWRIMADLKLKQEQIHRQSMLESYEDDGERKATPQRKIRSAKTRLFASASK
ncbi:unnamed protein product [Aphanomyces euteiches]|uniref:Uncharacterized protein n=1 Tax=Aphanomyces euteiches TaxID=100861 RepID=A0A6G0XU50_9STRA|nr:hypothetical protein Ae201684_001297 [Aphanomyces euteiches]KAH9099743.1 hypothetical protein Ae201684P_018754 [Aphanomyces euteiches]KAH9101882.1 hypothetical protein AeMF1_021437 [Aphanomyces euteiches]KAH9157206.1 hypothetical protein AeRB84_000933 [Aphanomyces euteiches]KAH9163761.1 hypothetical protein LEN26_000335 [Aphanomyces euteiches]